MTGPNEHGRSYQWRGGGWVRDEGKKKGWVGYEQSTETSIINIRPIAPVLFSNEMTGGEASSQGSTEANWSWFVLLKVKVKVKAGEAAHDDAPCLRRQGNN